MEVQRRERSSLRVVQRDDKNRYQRDEDEASKGMRHTPTKLLPERFPAVEISLATFSSLSHFSFNPKILYKLLKYMTVDYVTQY